MEWVDGNNDDEWPNTYQGETGGFEERHLLV